MPSKAAKAATLTGLVGEVAMGLFQGRVAVECVDDEGVTAHLPGDSDDRRAWFFWYEGGRVQIQGEYAGRLAYDWMQTSDRGEFAWDGFHSVHTVHPFESEDALRALMPRVAEYLVCLFRDMYVIARLATVGAHADVFPAIGRVEIQRGGAPLLRLRNLLNHSAPTLGAVLHADCDLGDLVAAWGRRVLALGAAPGAGARQDSARELSAPADTPARIIATGELLAALAAR